MARDLSRSAGGPLFRAHTVAPCPTVPPLLTGEPEKQFPLTLSPAPRLLFMTLIMAGSARRGCQMVAVR